MRNTVGYEGVFLDSGELQLDNEENPLLSILIPSRNRRAHLVQLIANLHVQLGPWSEKIEIIVSDNSDLPYMVSDFTVDVKVVRPPKPLATAEENLLFGLSFVTGKFVWPIGDDDLPLKEGIHRMMNLCQEDTYDCMVFNSAQINESGLLVNLAQIRSQAEVVSSTYAGLLMVLGFQSYMACISLTVFRRNKMKLELVDEIQNLGSPIYSHVALYAASFKNVSAAFINCALVQYRINLHDLEVSGQDHWLTYSDTQETFYRYSWTLGFIKQVTYLMQMEALPQNYFDLALETNHNGQKFHLATQIAMYYIEQIILDCEKSTSIRVTVPQHQEFLEFLRQLSPAFSSLEMLIQENLIVPSSMPKVAKKAFLNEVLQLRRNYWMVDGRFPFRTFYVKSLNNYNLYNSPLGYFALPGSQALSDLHVLLKFIPLPKELELQSATLEELKELCMKARSKSTIEMDHLDASLRNYSNFPTNSNFGILRRVYQKLPRSVQEIVRKVWQSIK